MNRQAVAQYAKKPRKLVRALGRRGFFNWLPDRLYLKFIFYGETGKRLNLVDPFTFNEKLQWLKIYDRNPLYHKLVDKYDVRKYIADIIGDEYLIPLIGVWNNVDSICFDKLPENYVIKCTHGSSSNIICKDNNSLNIHETKLQLVKWMKYNWYWFGREWPYKNIKPRIIAEEYLVDESGYELKDYKIHCFNGEPKLIQVFFGRGNVLKHKFYDVSWNYISISTNYPTDPVTVINKPERLLDILELAKKLSEGIPYIRVDFYSVGNKIYFGELTLYPASGFGSISPKVWDSTLGSWINLKLAYGEEYNCK